MVADLSTAEKQQMAALLRRVIVTASDSDTAEGSQ